MVLGFVAPRIDSVRPHLELISLGKYSNPPKTEVIFASGKRRWKIGLYDEPMTIKPRNDFGASGIPRIAMDACAGWWAGGGDVLYVTRSRHSYKVYIKQLEEQWPLPRHFDLLKVLK